MNQQGTYYAYRKWHFIILFGLAGIILIVRLFYLQVLDERYKYMAFSNALRKITEYPLRGYIYDRNNKLLVYNEPSFDLMVIPIEVKNCDTLALCKILQIDKDEFLRRIKKACQHPNSPRKESIFEKQLTPEIYVSLQEKMYRFNGFFVQKRSVRKYPRPIAAHLLGYVGEVSKQKAIQDPYYREGDYIGVSGIEKSYEEALRGVKGVQIAITDVHNRMVGRYMNGLYDTLAIPGKPLYCTIDADLQEYGEKLMQNKRGAIVAIEPSTGEILCLISSPTYDPNLLVGGRTRAKNFAMLYADSINRPLFNRALQAMYPPGSVFKLIDALIGQHEKVLFRNTSYPCAMGYPPMGGKPKCHRHPPVDLPGSIAHSCNSYYSYVFRSIVDQRKFNTFKEGYNHWRNMVMSFGPGRSLGTDLPYDKPGNVPSEKYYDRVFGKNGWRSNTIVSLGIGQAELTLVPLQMANVVAIIANKGYYYIPHCIIGVGNEKNIPDSAYLRKNYVAVTDTNYYNIVIEGMQKCLESGTAYASRVKDITICGKTGTAQNPHGKDHAVFMAFAPKENPKIAIACLVENAGFGGVWSAPIVTLMIEKYLKGKTDRPELEKRILEANLIASEKTTP
jgi:penicillin-binding protein 2